MGNPSYDDNEYDPDMPDLEDNNKHDNISIIQSQSLLQQHLNVIITSNVNTTHINEPEELVNANTGYISNHFNFSRRNSDLINVDNALTPLMITHIHSMCLSINAPINVNTIFADNVSSEVQLVYVRFVIVFYRIVTSQITRIKNAFECGLVRTSPMTVHGWRYRDWFHFVTISSEHDTSSLKLVTGDSVQLASDQIADYKQDIFEAATNRIACTLPPSENYDCAVLAFASL
jgi:hypothetical protein